MHPARRRLAFLPAAIAAIAAVVALMLPAGPTPAATVSAARNSVGATHPETILTVGVSHPVSPGERRCEPAPQPGFAAGACVAAEAAGGARFAVSSSGVATDLQPVDAVQAGLSRHVAAALQRFASQGFTQNQVRALVRKPGLRSVFQGERIDTFVKETVANDPSLSGLDITGRGVFGADFVDLATSRWYDVTTPGEWVAHVARYGPGGVPVFYP
jgi:hypothetical protein